MSKFDIYQDIAKRTNGDIYIGVVGPVRVGKSTFITNFMNTLVLPNIRDKNALQRTTDELPQAGDGTTIMTTQPKFVPNEAVKVTLNQNLNFNVRLIDCVGYLIPGVSGHKEGNKPRFVKTPWSKKDMPFEEAAELGTKKVIENHSTVAVLVTTDGSISELPRQNYKEAEERIAKELTQAQKPFVVVLNSKNPEAEESKQLAAALETKYNTSVIAVNVSTLNIEDVNAILGKLLSQFPITCCDVKLPKYLQALSSDNWIISEIIEKFSTHTQNLVKVSDYLKATPLFADHSHLEAIANGEVSLGTGRITYTVNAKPHLFYKVLSTECGAEIDEDYKLVSFIKSLTHAKQQYDKLEEALLQVEKTGYGIVTPSDNLVIEPPQVQKSGGRYGLKVNASTSALHIIQVDLNAEVSPIVGSQQQTEELVENLTNDYNTDPSSILETNVFGRSLHSLINEELFQKIHTLPDKAQIKLRRLLNRLTNEKKSNFIAFLY